MQEPVEWSEKRLVAVEQRVTAIVASTLANAAGIPPALIAYLRTLELAVRAHGTERQTIQVISSGRRLLGDREDLTRFGSDGTANQSKT
ncbi:MAG: hypothetical protein CL858_30115 [Cupriavidus sp.]|nr:hypothetical protein [Cupriavidus sp.]